MMVAGSDKALTAKWEISVFSLEGQQRLSPVLVRKHEQIPHEKIFNQGKRSGRKLKLS
jgi:hypothetical protein